MSQFMHFRQSSIGIPNCFQRFSMKDSFITVRHKCIESSVFLFLDLNRFFMHVFDVFVEVIDLRRVEF